MVLFFIECCIEIIINAHSHSPPTYVPAHHRIFKVPNAGRAKKTALILNWRVVLDAHAANTCFCSAPMAGFYSAVDSNIPPGRTLPRWAWTGPFCPPAVLWASGGTQNRRGSRPAVPWLGGQRTTRQGRETTRIKAASDHRTLMRDNVYRHPLNRGCGGSGFVIFNPGDAGQNIGGRRFMNSNLFWTAIFSATVCLLSAPARSQHDPGMSFSPRPRKKIRLATDRGSPNPTM
jgi:hypothetical protein